MRALLLLCSLLLIAPAAAQMTGPSYTLQAEPAPVFVEPGVPIYITLHAERVCPNRLDILPATEAKIVVSPNANATFAAPGHVVFPEQHCAYMTTAAVSFRIEAMMAKDANPGPTSVQVLLHPQSGGLLSPGGGQEAKVEFLIVVPEPVDEPEPVAVDAKAAPGAAVAAATLALGLAALARRRSNA